MRLQLYSNYRKLFIEHRITCCSNNDKNVDETNDN